MMDWIGSTGPTVLCSANAYIRSHNTTIRRWAVSLNGLNQVRKGIEDSDEYYTLYNDVDLELSYYTKYLKGKKIYLPCDGPQSMFVKWFKNHPELGCKVTYTSDDYRNSANIKLMREQDVVITNPPFSLCTQDREKGIPFIPLLLSLGVDFLIVCPLIKLNTAKIIPYYSEGAFHFGYNRIDKFKRPDGELKHVAECYWITNLNVKGRPYRTLTYSRKPLSAYPRDIETGIIVVDSIRDVPRADVMLVPITSLVYFPPSEWSLEYHKHTIVKDEYGNPQVRFRRTLVRKRK